MQCDANKLARIYQLIENNPGERAAEIQRLAQTRTTYLYNNGLHIMEDLGFLLYEDDRGRLYPFKVCREAKNILRARENGTLGPNEVLKTSTARIIMR